MAELRDKQSPDKHRDPQLKLSAQNQFEKVQHAYEGISRTLKRPFTPLIAVHYTPRLCDTVLSDPRKRSVYDILGEEGLKSNWEVGQRLKTPLEVRYISQVATSRKFLV